MSVINTNITSMIGQQNLQSSQSNLQTSMERLSSGLRINSAKDDAAGQAIANRFQAQTTGLSQAQRNANDGISVAQTAEGALDQINDNVQRVRELTVQAANGTNSEKDLTSIQDEIDQRMDEIDRISDQTDFNGVKVLKEDNNLKIQVGANDNEVISVDITATNSSTLGLGSFDVQKAFAADGPETVKTVEETSTVDFSGSTETDKVDISNLTSATSTTVGKADDGNWYAEVTGGADAGHYAIDVDSTGVSAIALDSANKLSAPTGYAAETGSAVEIPTGNTKDVDYSGVTLSDAAAGGEISRVVDDGQGNYFVEVKGADDAEGNGLYAANIDASDGTVSVSDFTEAGKLSDDKAANLQPLEALDKALNQIDSLRSDLGAVQNRFESAIENLSTNETNLTAAQSRIEDADYATEVANMTKNQILQQAGTSVLAQANQLPQNVLSLLG